MNRRAIVASLNKIANVLDNTGLYQEANSLTNIMKKLAYNFNDKEREFETRRNDEYERDERYEDDDFELGDYEEIGERLEANETMQEYKNALSDPNSDESNGIDTRLTDRVYRLLEEALMGTPLEGELREGDTYDDLEHWISGEKSLEQVFEDRERVMNDRLL